MNQARTASLPFLVVETNHAFHLIANETLAAGQRLFFIAGDLVSRPSRYSVQIGRDQHVDLLNPPPLAVMKAHHPWRFMNHACEPSARIAGREVIALRALFPGEEITFDYDTTEWEMAEGFRCHCGSALCRGEIRGYKFLSPEARMRLGNAAAPYLLHR